MKKKLNGLIITYCYPPYNSPESFVTKKLIDAMSEYCNLTLVKPCFENSIYENRGKNFNSSLNEINVEIPGYVKTLLNMKRLPLRPDRFLLYYPVFKKTISKINIEKFDFMMTRSQFHSTHLLGLYLKKKYKIKWYAHFSDPWYKSPVQRRVILFDSLSYFIQSQIFKYTDFNMFPLEELKNYFNKQIKKDINKNSFIVPHSLKKKNNIKIRNTRTTIRFFGKIYAGRKITNTLIALTKTLQKNKELSAEFFIDDDFINSSGELINEFKNIKFFKYIEYDKYIDKLNDSLILILIDIDEDFGNLFFQSKLVDYLQSFRPILHVGKSLTYNKKIIIKNNGLSCYNDSLKIYNSLNYLIKNAKNFKPNFKLINSFSSDIIAKKLAKRIFKENS